MTTRSAGDFLKNFERLSLISVGFSFSRFISNLFRDALSIVDRRPHYIISFMLGVFVSRLFNVCQLILPFRVACLLT